MLRPKPMARVLVLGPRYLLESSIEVLHDLKIIHIVDYTGEDEAFRIGKPLPGAVEISDSLVKLRSISNTLGLAQVTGLQEVKVGPDARDRILSLETNIAEEDASRKKAEALLSELSQRIEVAHPFAALGLDLGLYRGYRNLTVFVGRAPGELEGLEGTNPDMEVVRAGDAVAIFVEKAKADGVRDFLARQGFVSLDIPAAEGDPSALLEKLTTERVKWEERLTGINRRLEVLREKYAAFILGAEDYFAEAIEKAEAPLRFATTEHSFVIDGWIPEASVSTMKGRLEALGPIHVDVGGDEGEHSDPPVLLDNPKPVKPFEMLLGLYSTPSYREADPTLILALIFPLFFGLMIGDVGYGAVWVGLGALGLAKLPRGSDFRDLVYALWLGGIFSLIFGLVLYGEMFGVPFYSPVSNPPIYGHVTHVGEGEPLSWEHLVGLQFPLRQPVFSKLSSVQDLIILSIVAAFLHLLIGFLIGVRNELGHSKKHAVAKIAWILILFGLFTLILVRAWDPSLDPGQRKIANDILSIPPLGYFPGAPGLPMETLGFGALKPIPFATVGFIIAGAGILVFTESPLAVVEIVGLLANMISYARLAGIAVAKAAMAEAFNVGLFNTVLHGGTLMVILAIIGLFVAHMIIFFLGAISAAIQSIRLHYVEQFLKFFKGGGIPFQPFGLSSKTTEA